jgi:hypothetical protein
MYSYYLEYIKKNSVAYVRAWLFDSNNADNDPAASSFEREALITVFGKFTYNPKYPEGGYITDPSPYQLEIYDYYIN